MSCTHYIKGSPTDDGKCKDGFPVTTGCWATGELEKSTMKYVKCCDEEWAGKVYFDNGGKPLINQRAGEMST